MPRSVQPAFSGSPINSILIVMIIIATFDARSVPLYQFLVGFSRIGGLRAGALTHSTTLHKTYRETVQPPTARLRQRPPEPGAAVHPSRETRVVGIDLERLAW